MRLRDGRRLYTAPCGIRTSLQLNEVNLLIKHNALDKNDLDEEILEQLDIQDLENVLEEIEESREEETFRNWVCTFV